MVEFAQGNQVSFKSRLYASTRTNHCSPRSIEARVGIQAPAHIAEPEDSLPEQIQARGDLDQGQEIE
jgi:hypothetical protein